ncbi:hypothetical protein GOP47_0010828 [Adiantum capillus-veneris]|uniref:Uncharacterized protein n=1 Tax=Adiantum capillus-veneris TaxID=13818 RepID=A0A9D4UW29_ADICA|nr:hypothetical protein GOP47_0010828 [Adiantum capillus-veneris]
MDLFSLNPASVALSRPSNSCDLPPPLLYCEPPSGRLLACLQLEVLAFVLLTIHGPPLFSALAPPKAPLVAPSPWHEDSVLFLYSTGRFHCWRRPTPDDNHLLLAYFLMQTAAYLSFATHLSLFSS